MKNFEMEEGLENKVEEFASFFVWLCVSDSTRFFTKN
jgi:hypothetical protein